MITLVYKIDKVYGGRDYIEFIESKGVYKTGSTRAHKGHYKGDIIEIEVSTKRALKEIESQLIYKGFEDETRTF